MATKDAVMNQPDPGLGLGTSGLIVRDISKTFVGTRALVNVSARFPRGSITALLGRNGCGKSTLIKILCGFYQPDAGSGEVLLDGRPLPLPISPRVSHGAGLRFLHQDLGLVHQMTVADNFAYANGFPSRVLGRIPSKRYNTRVAEALERLEIRVLPTDEVGALTPTERTMVAIARAFAADQVADGSSSTVIALDEPTAALPATEIERVFKALRQIRDAGAAVVFVSHRIDEVMALCDRAVVLRDGQLISDGELAGLKSSDVVSAIVGQAVERTYTPRTCGPGGPVLKARGMRGPRLKGVDLEVCAGEVLGITGLKGCGRSELIRMICGDQKPTAGEVTVGQRVAKLSAPVDAISLGLGYVPQDRRAQGCLPVLRMRENISLSDMRPFYRRGFLRKNLERADTMKSVRELGIRPPDPEKVVARLSGGNQQKVVLAKWIRLRPKVLVLDEPTQGIDIGAKHEIGQLIRNLADEGVAIIIGSSDFEELVPLCDRVLVLDRGSLIAEVPASRLSEAELIHLSTRTKEGQG